MSIPATANRRGPIRSESSPLSALAKNVVPIDKAMIMLVEALDNSNVPARVLANAPYE